MSTYEVRGIIDEDPASASASDIFFTRGDVIDRKHDSGELAISHLDAERLEVERKHDSGLYRLLGAVRHAWQHKGSAVRDYQPTRLESAVAESVYVPTVPSSPMQIVAIVPASIQRLGSDLIQEEKDNLLIEAMGRKPHDYVFAGFKGLDEVPDFKGKGDDYFLAGVDLDRECSRAPFIPRRVDPMVLNIMRMKPARWDLSQGKPEEDEW